MQSALDSKKVELRAVKDELESSKANIENLTEKSNRKIEQANAIIHQLRDEKKAQEDAIAIEVRKQEELKKIIAEIYESSAGAAANDGGERADPLQEYTARWT